MPGPCNHPPFPSCFALPSWLLSSSSVLLYPIELHFMSNTFPPFGPNPSWFALCGQGIVLGRFCLLILNYVPLLVSRTPLYSIREVDLKRVAFLLSLLSAFLPVEGDSLGIPPILGKGIPVLLVLCLSFIHVQAAVRFYWFCLFPWIFSLFPSFNDPMQYRQNSSKLVFLPVCHSHCSGHWMGENHCCEFLSCTCAKAKVEIRLMENSF